MSVGFVVPERRPMALTGRGMVSSMLRNLLFDMAWTADVLVSMNADQGVPLVLGDPTGPISHEFARIGARVRAWLRQRGGLRCETNP
jgi:hypothetical protein